jgi:hypothetical protein
MVVGVAAATVRATVLRTQFISAVAERTDLVERLYDDVLVDPDLTRLHTDLSAGQRQAVRTAAAGVGVNIRLALPPSVVRALLIEQVEAVVGWLRGDVDTLRLQVSLDPIIDNLHGLAASYVSEVLASAPTVKTDTVPELRERLAAVVAAIRAGQRPGALPSLDAFRADPATAEVVLLSFLPRSLRAALQPAVHAALQSGDGADALAVVLEQAARGAAALAGADLIDLAGGRRVDFTSYLAGTAPASTADTVRTVRWWLGTPLLMILVFSVVLGLLGLGVLVFPARGTAGRRAARAGLALGAGALLSTALAVVAWAWLGSIVPDVHRSSWPASVQRLVHDTADTTRGAVLQTWLRYTIAVLIAGLGALLGGLLVQWLQSAPVRTRSRTISRRQVAVGAAALGLLLLAAGLIPANTRATKRCNGATYLCSRRYDQVVELATHNAMANTEDRFLFPLQDPDIDTQLDAGARALQLDSWTWETPEQVAGRLASSDFPPQTVAAVRRFVEVVNPLRAGTWLCHSVCRLGARPIVESLVGLREWLDRNPREVVTVILQDETPAALTLAAVRDAKLVPLLARPPADPTGRWPTLGEMIASGHRLVLFTENADDAAPWLQNFYKYGEETPFAFGSVETMAGPASCVANRGGTGRRLFLLNHFVTPASGSRKQSAQANAAAFLSARIKECAAMRHRLPTVVAVDFATLGQAQTVVDELNRRGAVSRA